MITLFLRTIRDILYRDLRADHDDIRRRVLAGEAATDALLGRQATELELLRLELTPCGHGPETWRCNSTSHSGTDRCSAAGCPMPARLALIDDLRAELGGR